MTLDDRPLRWRGLVGLVALLVLARALLLLSLGDVFFYGEELEKGTATKAMLDGLAVPHHQLAYHYYEGGGFVTSHLNAPFFLALGPCLLALKLVALLFAVAILACGWRFVGRFFGARSALLFGVLFALCPESMQKISLLNLGIHYQALLFTILVLHFSFRVVFEEDRRPTSFFLLGLCAGFGTYFSYQVALTCAFAGLLILLRCPRVLVCRGSVAGWIGLGVGLAPLGVMWLLVGREILDIHGASLAGGEGGGLGALIAFLRSLFLGREARELAAPVLYPLLLLACLAAGLRAGRLRGPALALFLYLLFFLASYALSGFAVAEVRHDFYLARLSQAWLLCSLLLAVLLPRLSGPVERRLRGPAAVLLAGIGIWHALALAGAGRPLSPLANLRLLGESPGYDYPQYFAKVKDHLEGDDAGKLRVLLGFREEEPRELRAAAALALFSQGNRPLAEIEASCRAVEPDGWPDFLLGLRYWLRQRHRGANPDPAVRFAELEGYPPADRPHLAEGLGRLGLGVKIREDWLQREASWRPESFHEEYLQGVGWRVHRHLPWRLRPDLALAFIEGVEPATSRHLLLRGYRRAALDGRLSR